MKILILTTNPLHNGPRLIREIDALKNDFQLVATGQTPPHDPAVKYVNSKKIKFTYFEYTINKIFRTLTGKVYTGKFFTIQQKVNKLINQEDPDLIIVHNPLFLPYLFEKRHSFKIVYHAHEYHPLEFEDNKKWRITYGKIYYNIYRKYLKKTDLVINVCEGIANKCLNEFNIPSVVIPNASYYSSTTTVRPVGETIRIIHHGVAIRERHLERMIEMGGLLGPGYEIDIMLVYQDKKYYNELVSLARNYDNVRLIDPVKFEDIISFINQYDIGLFLLPPSNFNYLHALPNKLFEFIQAKLCIAIGPSPEMKKIVLDHDLGVVSENFSSESLSNQIISLTRSEIYRFKQNAEKAAKLLSAEKYQVIFKEEIKELLVS